jgi:predicted HAD superfamily Cof-like phosphohydrolase
MQEEINEMKQALLAEDVVDAVIDLMYVAIGTLELFEVDTQKAWDTVHAANMAKEPGFNENRPNEFGFPDLIKPEGWKPPCHVGNTGKL